MQKRTILGSICFPRSFIFFRKSLIINVYYIVQAVNMWDEINPYIDKNLKNWIQERVAEMDIIIMQLAVTEIIAYKEIPIPVSLNEYIEIAKWYSTENSGSFINGILYKVIEDLKKEGKIQKIGRGLITKK